MCLWMFEYSETYATGSVAGWYNSKMQKVVILWDLIPHFLISKILAKVLRRIPMTETHSDKDQKNEH